MVLSREEFKRSVFDRDGSKCVVCKKPAIDAHHIIDRSLWDDQGYHTNNGVSVCEKHHWDAERTIISCDDLRKLAGIQELCYPEHFHLDEKYDHWGNIVLPNGMRVKGELFDFGNVQEMLRQAGVLDRFLKYLKYPRTYHLSDSPNLQNDDRQHPDEKFFEGKQVVASLKLDGEGTTMYPDYIHARSLDSKHHESRSWVKALHGRLQRDIFPGWRVCGENLYAEHSIHYYNLEDYFYVFNIWNQLNFCLRIDETLEYCDLLGLHHVPIFYRGVWDREKIHQAFLDYDTGDIKEGYVIRTEAGFYYRDYRRCTAKYVRKGHVQTSEFWMTKPVIPNDLKKAKKDGQ